MRLIIDTTDLAPNYEAPDYAIFTREDIKVLIAMANVGCIGTEIVVPESLVYGAFVDVPDNGAIGDVKGAIAEIFQISVEGQSLFPHRTAIVEFGNDKCLSELGIEPWSSLFLIHQTILRKEWHNEKYVIVHT